MANVINKNMFSELSSYGMRWELQELQNVIKEKKDQAVKNEVNMYLEILMTYVDSSEKNEKLFKNVLEELARSIQQIEREI